MHLLDEASSTPRPADGPRALLIAGPTASGKSALALRLAERCGGTVVNADAMQVYADLAILTARPGAADCARARHALYGSVDGADGYSVSRWLADVTALLAAGGGLPIIVGGTGLYFRALTAGLSAIPAVPAEVRDEIRRWAAGRVPAELHAALRQRDPATAAVLRPTDPQRLVRALEVHAATGGSLVGFQQRREPPLLDATRCAAVTLVVERSVLRQRLDERFDAMMAAGAMREVERLRHRELSPALPVMRTLGVPQLLAVLGGEADPATAIAVAKAETRRYAKRQETFFRHQLPGFAPATFADAERMLTTAIGYS